MRTKLIDVDDLQTRKLTCRLMTWPASIDSHAGAERPSYHRQSIITRWGIPASQASFRLLALEIPALANYNLNISIDYSCQILMAAS